MKMDRDEARRVIFRAMLQSEGNRAKAAKILNVSLRTFYRYLDEYEMHPMLERAGWQYNVGPPRGQKLDGNTVIRSLIANHIRAGRGSVDFGRLALEVYGQDTPTTRQRLYTTLDEMKKQKRVILDESSGKFALP